ncbi:MAG: autotransporter domain-containing protein [Phascolarctobacterium faecium]
MVSGGESRHLYQRHWPLRQFYNGSEILWRLSDKADYKHHVYSISVEYGQRFDYQQGLFFEPQARLRWDE